MEERDIWLVDQQQILCINVSICGVLLNEFASRFNVITHQHGEDFVGFSSILYGYLLQEARLRIHGCLPKLLGIHLSQTFVALCVQALVVFFSFNILVNESLTLLLRVAIFTRFLIGTLVPSA